MRLMVLTAAALASGRAASDDWPQFRGPGGSGVSTEERLPTEWGPEKNVAWRVKIPGYGWSCPVVVGGKVFVTTVVARTQKKPAGGAGMMLGFIPNAIHTWELHCLRRRGRQAGVEDRDRRHEAAGADRIRPMAMRLKLPRPTANESSSPSRGLAQSFAFDMNGKEAWKADIGVHPTQFNHGPSSSPVIADGRVYLQCDNERRSFLLTLDVKTGKEVWPTPPTGRVGARRWSGRTAAEPKSSAPATHAFVPMTRPTANSFGRSATSTDR